MVNMVKIAGRFTGVIDAIRRLPPGTIARINRGGLTMHAWIVIRTDWMTGLCTGLATWSLVTWSL